MIVIDASVVVEICLGTAVGKSITQKILELDTDLVAPEVLSLEVVHALRKQLHLKLITPSIATEAFRIYCLMPIQHLSHAELLQRVWELKSNMSPYDASYIALAEKLAAPLWACDKKHAKTPTHEAEIVYFAPAP